MSISSGFQNLKSGVKIGGGFGLVGLLFLGVIVLYNTTLSHSVATFTDDILGRAEVEKSSAMQMNILMLEARRGEKDFQLRKDLKYVEAVKKSVADMQQIDEEMLKAAQANQDAASAKLATEIKQKSTEYLTAFLALAKDETEMGLDEKSGLQGKFRESAHGMEKLIKRYDTEEIYVDLLQMRRSEKDFQLRKDQKYVGQVEGSAKRFVENLAASTLPDELKKELSGKAEHYLKSFKEFAAQSTEQSPETARTLAHEIEALLKSRYVPGIARIYLTIRKDEKDYLLRGDEKYVANVTKGLDALRKELKESAVADSDKTALTDAIQQYQQAFLSLTAKEKEAKENAEKMRAAVHALEPLLEAITKEATTEMTKTTQAIMTSVQHNTNMAMAVSVGILLLCALLAVTITRSMTGPLANLLGMFGRLADGDLTIHSDSQRTDEVGQLSGTRQSRLNSRVTSPEGVWSSMGWQRIPWWLRQFPSSLSVESIQWKNCAERPSFGGHCQIELGIGLRRR